ncbi:uracil-DNA glycosylase [Methylobacterium sp. J-068]|uniref:uracil-DNA glycosylase n=1 Tax=Methylobacterium sp. J-068 TaxID=2836649 RepID=UPI001FB9B70D|nr:uracil-DNA glycosylase [Methylobacterium sp. J-068]MCJ2036619.1 uracil-DNA glycosylase [Methylobacterium sp. J-068]
MPAEAPPRDPKSLRDPVALAARKAGLDGTHIAPIRALARRIAEARGAEVPDPDPLDGGVGARLLLLLETPGPSIRGTGFVSRDNPTGTAANLFRFLAESGIPRRDTLIWNTIPWVIHAPGALNRPPRRSEILAAIPDLAPLLACLPHLRVVVLAGRVAGMLAPTLATLRPDLPVIPVPHPSPTYVCTAPSVATRIRAGLARAAACIGGGHCASIAGNCPPMPLNAGNGPRSGTSSG